MSGQTSCPVYRATSRSRSARRPPRRHRRLRPRRRPRPRLRRRRRRRAARKRRRSPRGTRTLRTSSRREWWAVCTSSPTGRRKGAIYCCPSRSQGRPNRRSGNRLVGLLLLILVRHAVHQLCHLASPGGGRGNNLVPNLTGCFPFQALQNSIYRRGEGLILKWEFSIIIPNNPFFIEL